MRYTCTCIGRAPVPQTWFPGPSPGGSRLSGSPCWSWPWPWCSLSTVPTLRPAQKRCQCFWFWLEYSMSPAYSIIICKLYFKWFLFFICSLLKGTIRTKGTNSPFCMISTRFLPLGVPAWTSALSRSPVERCVKPYFSTIRSHCVPFPEPGPPAKWKVQIPSRSLYIYIIY